MPPTIWTIGHSTRSADELVTVLRAHEIEMLADVRRFPGSRRLPQFEASALDLALAPHGIGYHPDSRNDGWRNLSFRAYADYLDSDEFADGLLELLLVAEGLRTAVMCAEVLWWRCHRRLISDVLVSLGGEVRHIRDVAEPESHRLTAPARLADGVLSYAASD
jgi:uncharacterized protein (DUF488 family)